MTQFYDAIGNTLRRIFDWRISGTPVLAEEKYFSNASRFKAAWREIRTEALTVQRKLHNVPRFHDLMPEQASISANDRYDWRLFVLKAYGTNITANQAQCPMTTSVLADCPEVLSASFSFLAPGKYIPEHRGPFRGILRFHLGLSMPLDADGALGAVLWIDGVPHRLADGDWLLWDDTFPHEVYNATDDVRVALLLDVWRVGMPADMVLLSHLVVGAARAAIWLRTVPFSV